MTERRVRIVAPEPHYTLFDSTRNDLPEIIVVNDALLAFQHHEIFPWHLEINIQAEELVERGMPSPDESKLLLEIGDMIESAIEGKNALFLARSTWDGLRQLSFRVHDPELANDTLQSLLADKPNTRFWEYRMHHDPEWQEAGYIFSLFPLANGPDG
ncbi:DUF695 domain-containing protein [Luteimonas sp. RD2P54]|uniref:DUF695 domain-containing protein n=1 Tax=Luteimonas endophytica TaxID=3042023 RepID=A0ABT6J574_9GAMM|nr:DUF695 domain-containing protein [Luteimonas endophytica]MDH5821973.1 DUF695 domain-containing protein [Luteimonas endophytica]